MGWTEQARGEMDATEPIVYRKGIDLLFREVGYQGDGFVPIVQP